MKLCLLLFLVAACSAIKPNNGEKQSNGKTVSINVSKKYLPSERFRKSAKHYIPPSDPEGPKTNIEKSKQLTTDTKIINHSRPKETVVKYIPPNNNDLQQYKYKPIYLDTVYNPQIHTGEDQFVPYFESKKYIAPSQDKLKYQPYLPPIDPQYDQISNQYVNPLEQQLPVQNKLSSKSDRFKLDIESHYPAIVEKYVQPYVEILPEKFSTQAPVVSKSNSPKQSIEIQKPSVEYLPPYFSMPENEIILPSPYTIRRYDSQLQQTYQQYPYNTENYPQGPMTPKPHLSTTTTTSKPMYNQDMTTAIIRQPSTTTSYQQMYNQPIESSTARSYYNQQSTTPTPYKAQEISTSTPYYNQQINTNNQSYKVQELSTSIPYYNQPSSTAQYYTNYNKPQETSSPQSYFNQQSTTTQPLMNTANYNQQSTTKSYTNNPYLYPQSTTTSIPISYYNQQSTTAKPYYNSMQQSSETMKNNTVFKNDMYRQNQPNNYYNNQPNYDSNLIYNRYAEARSNNGQTRAYGERIIPTPPLYASSRSSNSPMVNIQTGNQQSSDSQSETSDLTPINFVPQIPSQFKAQKPIISTPNPFVKQQYSNLPQYQVTYDQPPNQGPPTESVPILRQTAEMDPDGSFSYETLTGDQTHIMQQGHILNAGTEQEEQVIQGSYSYLGADGITYTVNYIADSNGFRATGDHLPTSPPIPDVIQRSIEYNIAEEAASNQQSAISTPNQQSYQYAQQLDNSKKYLNQAQTSQRRSNQQAYQYPQQQVNNNKNYQNQPQIQTRNSNQQAFQYSQVDKNKNYQIQPQAQERSSNQQSYVYPQQQVENAENYQIQTQANEKSSPPQEITPIVLNYNV